jgi:hypothetical protein
MHTLKLYKCHRSISCRASGLVQIWVPQVRIFGHGRGAKLIDVNSPMHVSSARSFPGCDLHHFSRLPRWIGAFYGVSASQISNYRLRMTCLCSPSGILSVITAGGWQVDSRPGILLSPD